jgi:hypothetical protein
MNLPGNPSSTRALLARVLLLNLLLVYPVLYLEYKHFNPALTPMDIPGYLSMVEAGPASVGPPYRYRVVAPLAVRAMRPLPAYDIPVAFGTDPVAKRDFFHFLLLNTALTVLTSGLVFVWLKDKLGSGFAWLGSLLYLFSFYTVVTNLIPMTDASCHLALMACLLLFERRKPLWFALACLIGVFTKETLLVVLFPWIAVRAFADGRDGRGPGAWRYLAYALPAAAAYATVTRLFPAPSEFAYYSPGFLLGNLLHAFNPARYDVHMVFQIFLAHVPLLVCLAIYACLRWRGGRGAGSHEAAPRSTPAPAFVPELWVFFFLIWLGMAMDLGNNTGRVAFMAFPAIVWFEARVIEAVWGKR